VLNILRKDKYPTLYNAENPNNLLKS